MTFTHGEPDAAGLEQFRSELATLTFELPVTDVLVRGRRLRQRRRRPPLIGGAVALLTVATLLVQGTGHQQPAFADWTAQPQTSSGNDMAAIDAFCHKAGLTAGAPRRVIDRRGSVAFAVYGDQRALSTCTAWRANGVWETGSAASDLRERPVQHRGKGRAVAFEQLEAGGTAQGLTQSAVGWAEPQVAKVVVTTRERTTVATLGPDGLFTAWWPAHLDVDGHSLELTTVTGYDAGGRVLGTEHWPLTTDERSRGYDDGVAGG